MADPASTSRLRTNLEIVNSSSKIKLKADPRPDMVAIAVIAENCLTYHETLALSTWKSAIRQIRVALENIEDIYDEAVER